MRHCPRTDGTGIGRKEYVPRRFRRSFRQTTCICGSQYFCTCWSNLRFASLHSEHSVFCAVPLRRVLFCSIDHARRPYSPVAHEIALPPHTKGCILIAVQIIRVTSFDRPKLQYLSLKSACSKSGAEREFSRSFSLGGFITT